MVEWSQGLGWDNVGIQLTAGANRIHFDSFAFPELLVGHYRVQQSIHNVFALPDGMPHNPVDTMPIIFYKQLDNRSLENKPRGRRILLLEANKHTKHTEK